jgi:hypothetical protein
MLSRTLLRGLIPLPATVSLSSEDRSGAFKGELPDGLSAKTQLSRMREFICDEGELACILKDLAASSISRGLGRFFPDMMDEGDLGRLLVTCDKLPAFSLSQAGDMALPLKKTSASAHSSSCGTPKVFSASIFITYTILRQ